MRGTRGAEQRWDENRIYSQTVSRTGRHRFLFYLTLLPFSCRALSFFLQVSVLATVLCMMVLLPLYYTVQCDPWRSGLDACEVQAGNTDFEQLTIENVVPYYTTEKKFQNGSSSMAIESPNNPHYNITSLVDIDIINAMDWKWEVGVTGEWVTCYVSRPHGDAVFILSCLVFPCLVLYCIVFSYCDCYFLVMRHALPSTPLT